MQGWKTRLFISYYGRLPLAPALLKLASLFKWLGGISSGFIMALSGKGHDELYKTIRFELIAHNSDGVFIPCMPAILLATKLANGVISQTGASSSVGMISRDEYLGALKDMDITWPER